MIDNDEKPGESVQIAVGYSDRTLETVYMEVARGGKMSDYDFQSLIIGLSTSVLMFSLGFITGVYASTP